jgi:hypothetical protein
MSKVLTCVFEFPTSTYEYQKLVENRTSWLVYDDVMIYLIIRWWSTFQQTLAMSYLKHDYKYIACISRKAMQISREMYTFRQVSTYKYGNRYNLQWRVEASDQEGYMLNHHKNNDLQLMSLGPHLTG